MLRPHKILSLNKEVWVSIGAIQCWSKIGNFYVGAKGDTDISNFASYKDDWNTHVLEHLIKGALQRGCSRFSAYVGM